MLILLLIVQWTTHTKEVVCPSKFKMKKQMFWDYTESGERLLCDVIKRVSLTAVGQFEQDKTTF